MGFEKVCQLCNSEAQPKKQLCQVSIHKSCLEKNFSIIENYPHKIIKIKPQLFACKCECCDLTVFHFYEMREEKSIIETQNQIFVCIFVLVTLILGYQKLTLLSALLDFFYFSYQSRKQKPKQKRKLKILSSEETCTYCETACIEKMPCNCEKLVHEWCLLKQKKAEIQQGNGKNYFKCYKCQTKTEIYYPYEFTFNRANILSFEMLGQGIMIFLCLVLTIIIYELTIEFNEIARIVYIALWLIFWTILFIWISLILLFKQSTKPSIQMKKLQFR